MQDFILRMGVNFSEAEKEKCFPTADRMIDLAKLAWSEGILGLEENGVSPDDSIFLKSGIELIVNGVDLALVEKIFQHSILSGGYTGSDLLERLVIAEGLLSIQSGVYPTNVYIIGAMLGQAYVTRVTESIKKSNENFFNSYIQQNKPASPESIPFEERLSQLTKVELRKLFTDINIGTHTLARAFKNCSSSFVCRMREGLYGSNFITFCESLRSLEISDPEYPKHTLAAQSEILDRLTRLEDAGEITLKQEG